MGSLLDSAVNIAEVDLNEVEAVALQKVNMVEAYSDWFEEKEEKAEEQNTLVLEFALVVLVALQEEEA